AAISSPAALLAAAPNLVADLPAQQNAALALDVNGDGHVSSIDALLIINRLNSPTLTQSLAATTNESPYLDTNGDGVVSSIDALLVINALNSGLGGEGEGSITIVAPQASDP